MHPRDQKADAADGHQLGGRKTAAAALQKVIDAEEKHERDEETDGEMRVVAPQRVNDLAGVGRPERDKGGQADAN